MASRLRLTLATGLVVLPLAGCATLEPMRSLAGHAGPIAWEVTDIRRRLDSQTATMTWEYTMILRNTGSTGISLREARVGVVVPRGDVIGGLSVHPFAHRLAPGAELRLATTGFSHRCRDCDASVAQQRFQSGVVRIIELHGVDESGRPVRVEIRVPLSTTVGLGATPVRDLKHVAGRWRGTIRVGSSSEAVAVTLREDGTYRWMGPRGPDAGGIRLSEGKVLFETSAGRKARLTLYEGGRERVLRIAYDGDWRGELVPDDRSPEQAVEVALRQDPPACQETAREPTVPRSGKEDVPRSGAPALRLTEPVTLDVPFEVPSPLRLVAPKLHTGLPTPVNRPDPEVYYAEVHGRIRARLVYPVDARRRRESGTVALRFEVDRDGSVRCLSIDRPSGIAVLDRAAVAAVRDALLPAIPDGLEDPVSITATFRFVLDSRGVGPGRP